MNDHPTPEQQIKAKRDAAIDRLRIYTATKLEEIEAECRRRNLPMNRMTLVARQHGNNDMSIVTTNDTRDGIIGALDHIWPV